ncbi:MAG: fasciclin domain-containing protein, partial [Ilumatobacteraceae bacterium]
TPPPTTPPTTPPPPTTTPPSTLPPSGPDALQVMQTNPELTEFVQALEDNDLTDLVDGPEPVTVLAPSNDFIEPAQLTADQVRRQLIGEALSEGELFERTTVATLDTDESLAVDGAANPPIVGGVTILEPDIPANNGFVQVVNGATAAES